MHRVYLIDQHPVVRLGLAALMKDSSNFEICGECDSARKALQIVPDVRPGLVVTNIMLPDMNGLELIKELQALCPDVPVLVFSDRDEMLYAERVVKAGGKGYISKEASPEAIVEAMSQTAKGNIFLTAAVTNHLLLSLSGNGNRNRRRNLEQLSDRELEVYELIGRGKGTHDIADQLCICIRTVEAHRTHIREKLGLPNAADVIRHAVMWVEAKTEDVANFPRQ
ncbi:MAG: response regulator transcription factor [Verrucomicrobiales bacterium]